MDTNEAQRAVAQAVAQRGYRDGWTDEQFALRQLAKLGEEVGELADSATMRFDNGMSTQPIWATRLITAGKICRNVFDFSRWERTELDTERAKAELVDVVVVALVLGDVFGFDVVAAAVDKAAADVSRGVRGGA